MKSNSLIWILAGVILLCMCIVPVTASCTFTTDSGTVTLGNGVNFHGTCDGSETVVYLTLTGPNMPSAGANMQEYDLPNSPVQNGNASTFLSVPVTGGSWSTMWWTQFFVIDPGTYTVYMDTAPNSPPVSSETYSLVLERDLANADIAVSSVPAGADVYFDTLYIGVTTNMTFHGWRTGSHTVGVFKDGYFGEQSTETLTAGTKTTVSYTLYAIPAPGPYIDIGAAGDHRYYFGETIKFSGNNTAFNGSATTTYLFMTGPGLPAGGARLNYDPKNSPVEDGNASSFTQANVSLSGKWSYYWPTTEMPKFDVGIYNIMAAAVPNVPNFTNFTPGLYHGTSIILQPPFISATANRRTGPAGTVFHIMGTREGGASPNYYANVFVTNNSPPFHLGSLPQNGVNPDDFSIESISGINSTFGRGFVNPDATFDYVWDTGNIAGGSVLPGGEYLFGVAMYPLNLTDVNGYWTKLSIGIEGPITADYVVDTSSGTAPLTVTFYDNSQGFPTQLNLSFGDGTWDNSTSWMYTHTYTSEGTFFPQIYAMNSISSDNSTNATISVNVTPNLNPDVAVGYNIILNDPDTLNGTSIGTTVSASTIQLAPATTVSLWGDPLEGRNFLTPGTVGPIYLIDNTSDANQEHYVTYVHVNLSTKTITKYRRTSPSKNIQMSFIAGKSPNAVGSGGGGGSGCGLSGDSSACSLRDCTNCYALLISGGYDPANNNIRYWDDISCMYKTLRQKYCYPEDHIYVLMSDGTSDGLDRRYGTSETGEPQYDNSPTNLDGIDRPVDVYGAATRQNVETTLTLLKGTNGIPGILGSDDHLFIFTTNHGGKEDNGDRVRLWLWNQEYIWDNEFTALLEGMQAKTITMTMEQCYSGGFVDDFINTAPPDQTRVIATAANAVEPSWGNDFSYAWISGVAGPANVPPIGNSDSLVSLRESFIYAEENDPSATALLEHPVYQDVLQNTGVSMGLSSCSRVVCATPIPLLNYPMPTDPNTDCIYEDISGDYDFIYDDVTLFFVNMKWMRENEPPGAFDLNGNGRIDFGDIVKLYQML